MRIISIGMLDTLTDKQRLAVDKLVEDLLEDLEDVDVSAWQDQDLVVYTIQDASVEHRVVIAPRSQNIRPGDDVEMRGWTATLVVSTNSPERRPDSRVDLAGALATS